MPLYPRRRFSTHLGFKIHLEMGPNQALQLMGQGPGGRRESAVSILIMGSGGETDDFDLMIKWHRDNSRERMFDQNFLVACDDIEMWNRSRAFLVKTYRPLRNRYEAKEVSLDLVTQILTWLWIGFLDWDEFVKESDFEEGIHRPKVLFKIV